MERQLGNISFVFIISCPNKGWTTRTKNTTFFISYLFHWKIIYIWLGISALRFEHMKKQKQLLCLQLSNYFKARIYELNWSVSVLDFISENICTNTGVIWPILQFMKMMAPVPHIFLTSFILVSILFLLSFGTDSCHTF